MKGSETPRQRLARLMDERRLDLELTWNDVAERAGITREGLRRTRTGTGRIRSLTKRGIERALRWERGSVDTILGGGDPTDAKDSAHPMDRAEALMDENERMAAELVARIKRLNERKRRAVEELVRALEEDELSAREPNGSKG